MTLMWKYAALLMNLVVISRRPDYAKGLGLPEPSREPASDFPLRDQALARLGLHEIVERHDDGDLTIRKDTTLYVVTTDGKMFRQLPNGGKIEMATAVALSPEGKSAGVNPSVNPSVNPTASERKPAPSIYRGTSQLSAAGKACIPCVPPNSLVISNTGVSPIKDLKAGDRVLDAYGGYSTITEVMERPFGGNLLAIKVPYQKPLLVTEEHPILAIKAHYCRKSPHRGSLCLPGKDNPRCQNCDLEYVYLPEWVPAKELKTPGRNQFTSWIVLMPRFQEVIDRETISVPELEAKVYVKPCVLVNAAFMQLAGLYLAEGSVTLQSRGALVRMDFGWHEEKLADETIGLLYEVFGVKAKLEITQSTRRVVVSSIILGTLFVDLFGKGALNKRIPAWMLSLPLEKQAALLKGYWEGDGSHRREKRHGKELNALSLKASTVSLNLAYSIRLLLHRLGIVHALAEYKTKDTTLDGRTIKSNGKTYVLSVGGPSALKLAKLLGIPTCDWRFLQSHLAGIDDQWVYLPVKGIGEIPYIGPVMNLRTFPSSTYTSSGIAVHNCGNDHFSTVAGQLGESMRFAREGDITHPEVLSRIAHAEDELNVFEREDGASEKVAKLPPAEKAIMDEMLVASRRLRHALSDIKDVAGLEKAAAEAQEARVQFRAKLFGLQLQRLSPEQVKRIAEKMARPMAEAAREPLRYIVAAKRLDKTAHKTIYVKKSSVFDDKWKAELALKDLQKKHPYEEYAVIEANLAEGLRDYSDLAQQSKGVT